MDIKATASHGDISAVLQQMRQIRDQATKGVANAPKALDVAPGDKSQSGSRVDFGGALKQAINSVNEMQQTAATSTNDFVTGKETNLVKVMVDGQKASIGFQAAVQVRNRMVTAYQDIMKMPI